MKLPFLSVCLVLSAFALEAQTQLTNYSGSSTEDGLPLIRKLIALNDGVLMMGDGLYYYRSNEVTEVTTSKFITYSGDDSVIYFGDSVLGGLYRYDGNELLSVSNSYIRGLKELNGNSYFYTNRDDELHFYDHSTKAFSVVKDLTQFRHWEEFNDDLYFVDDRSLYRHSYGNAIELVADSIIYQYSTPFLGGIKILDSNLYFSRESGHYKMDKNENVEKIASISDLEFPFLGSSISSSGKHLMCIGEDLSYHYDGKEFHKIIEDGILVPSFLSVGADHFVSHRQISDDRDFIYNAKERKLVELPYSFIPGVFKYQGDVKMVAVDYSGQDRNLKVIRADDSYDFANLEKDLNYSSNYSPVFDAVINGSEGVLMISPYMVYISNGDYRVDESLTIEARFQGLLQVGDLVYFVADDGIAGRQLYSYLTKAVSTQEDGILQNDVSIFPNPVRENLNLDHGSTDNVWKDYRIYDSVGKLVDNGQYSDIISVSDLKSGMYVLELADGEKSIFQSFIKL